VRLVPIRLPSVYPDRLRVEAEAGGELEEVLLGDEKGTTPRD
jgi:hypothetical protein